MSKVVNCLGIDASNIRHGGGITHLSQLLSHTEATFPYDRIIVWGSKSTLNEIDDQKWLIKKSHYLLEGNLLQRTLWQIFLLKKSLDANHCSALFVPGGSFYSTFEPVITFHQNLLPFETSEILRFKSIKKFLRFFTLRILQSFSFGRSNGIIFLSKISRSVVKKKVNNLPKSKIIYHGIESRFYQVPREQKKIEEYNLHRPFKIIYVSSIDYYKHQWNVVEAVSSLRQAGMPVSLHLYGFPNKNPMKKLLKAMRKHDKDKNYILYKGEADFKCIHEIYRKYDMSVFASSCETFGQIVLESMASGLPIVCSNRSSMKEIIKDGCEYFDPLSPTDIANTIRSVVTSSETRNKLALKSYSYSKDFSWEKTSESTFKFIKQIESNLS